MRHVVQIGFSMKTFQNEPSFRNEQNPHGPAIATKDAVFIGCSDSSPREAVDDVMGQLQSFVAGASIEVHGDGLPTGNRIERVRPS